MRRLVAFVVSARRDQRLDVGPLRLTTHARACQAEWTAYELGRDVAQMSGPCPVPPRKTRPNHLRAV
jgi:hypothetical protein